MAATRDTPRRTCVACRTERAKRDLVRIVRSTTGGDVRVDPRGKASGRGAYLCPDPACLERGLTGGALGRALATAIDQAARERLETDLRSELTRRAAASPRA